MGSYWKSKVLPKIKKVFGKDTVKKAAAADACKSFDETKEEISKQFEEKKAELEPKVIEVYEASSTEIKTLVKEPKEAGLRKHSVKVQKFLDELVKIDFPGTKEVSEASSKYGPSLVSGPVIFVFEKVSTFVVTEEKPREAELETPATTTTTTTEETTTTTTTVEETEKEIVVEEENPKEEVSPKEEEEKPKAEVEEPPKA